MYLKTLHARKNLANEDKSGTIPQPTILEYSLIEKDKNILLQDALPSQYGICVSMTIGEAAKEEAMVSDLSTDRKRGEDLLALLIRNSVTPVSVNEVVTDCFYI